MIVSGSGPLAVIVSELIETVVFASVAGIGVAIFFSFAIAGATHGIDRAREGRTAAAIGAALLAAAALLVCLAAIAGGILVMIRQ